MTLNAERKELPLAASQKFPKTARLRKKRDFSFRPYQRFSTENFQFIYSSQGRGRLGVSISKKVLRRATCRNRVRRLLREAFRRKLQELRFLDIHVIGLPPLTADWERLQRSDVEACFEKLEKFCNRGAKAPRIQEKVSLVSASQVGSGALPPQPFLGSA